ncbi:MAG: hypothetical protein NTZ73_04775 [Candidatus Diapherotrites archaeon]|nr:hypothetical protein [Candidatus Diapherotrites archaeon]
MAGILDFIKNLFKGVNKPKEAIEQASKIYAEPEKRKIEIHSIWDFLKINENTQVIYLISVIRFDEWVTMDEIRQRIFDLFQVNYQNERSLYPYLKTMVDLGLMEINNVGGKRKWRKRDLLIKIEQKKKSEEEKEEIAVSSETTV